MRWLLLLPLLVACADASRTETRVQTPPATRPVVVDSVIPTPVPTAADTGVRFDAAQRPLEPIVFEDACEGEDCSTRFDAVACLPTSLRAARTDSAPVVTRVALADTLRVTQRDLLVRRVGVVTVNEDFTLDSELVEGAGGDEKMPRADTVRLVRGDTVYLLNYLALGRWSWALHGGIHDSDEFWAAPQDGGLGGGSLDSTRAVGLSRPRTEDWWLVQPRSGQPGWWHADGREELQSIVGMQHWSDDCDQVRARASRGPANSR